MEYAKLVSLPHSGEVTLQGPSFTYTARPDFKGEDSFSIQIAGSINRIYGNSTIRVSVLVGSTPATVRPQAQDNPAKKMATAATQGELIKVAERGKSRFDWFTKISDLTTVGWLTVALYLMVSVNCAILARKVGLEEPQSRERVAWRWMAALLLGLGINRQLNLDGLFTEAGRGLALHQGWYYHRALVQLVFIAEVALAFMVVAITLLIWARYAPKSTRLALLGTTLVLTFLSIRTISYHYVDKFLGQKFLGFRWNVVLEVAGIGLVLLACLWRQGALSATSLSQLRSPAKAAKAQTSPALKRTTASQ
jgi:hypothetical protein